MKQYIVINNKGEKKTFTDINLTIEYMNKITPKNKNGEFHITIKECDKKEQIKTIECELQDMIGTFMTFQDNYAEFMKSCHDIMADIQMKLYNLKKTENAK